MTNHSASVWLAAAAVALSASGCAGTNNDATELKTAVTSYSNAYLSGDGAAAHSLLSQRCQQRLTETELGTTAQIAAKMYGTQTITSYEANISGTMARVTYTYASAEINQTSEPWVREDGAWKQDDC